MPIYEYSCDDCEVQFELLVRGEEVPTCPHCGQTRLTKQLSVPAAHTDSGEPACPAKDACDMSDSCGSCCGMAPWTNR